MADPDLLRPSVLVAAVALGGALASYGAASLLFADHSDRVRSRGYLAGLCLQGLAFGLAFVARTQMPLILVQSTISASVAVTAVGGMALGRWRLDRRDGLALAAVVCGIAAVGAASRPGPVTVAGWLPVTSMAVVGVVALLGLLWRPRPGQADDPATALRAAALLGSAAGLNFGSSAIAARMVAADPLTMIRGPMGVTQAVVLVGGLYAGQVLLTLALRRGRPDAASTRSSGVTVPVSAMYISGTLWPAAAGLAWLGDALVPGRAALAALGVALALAGVSVLSRTDRRDEAPPQPATPAS